MLTADVTDIGEVNPGDEVVFLGAQGDQSRASDRRARNGRSRLDDPLRSPLPPRRRACTASTADATEARAQRQHTRDKRLFVRRDPAAEPPLDDRVWVIPREFRRANVHPSEFLCPCVYIARPWLRPCGRAMKPAKPVFVCQECGSQAPKWQGRCADCGAWNSLVEERVGEAAASTQGHRYALPGVGRGRREAVFGDRSIVGRTHRDRYRRVRSRAGRRHRARLARAARW